jgi:hypothetical protein
MRRINLDPVPIVFRANNTDPRLIESVTASLQIVIFQPKSAGMCGAIPPLLLPQTAIECPKIWATFTMESGFATKPQKIAFDLPRLSEPEW